MDIKSKKFILKMVMLLESKLLLLKYQEIQLLDILKVKMVFIGW